jgi:hypothetical protein
MKLKFQFTGKGGNHRAKDHINPFGIDAEAFIVSHQIPAHGRESSARGTLTLKLPVFFFNNSGLSSQFYLESGQHGFRIALACGLEKIQPFNKGLIHLIEVNYSIHRQTGDKILGPKKAFGMGTESFS